MAEKFKGLDELARDRIVERIPFGFIFAAIFFALVANAFVELLLPWTWLRRFKSDENKRFIRRAWKNAATFAEIAFEG